MTASINNPIINSPFDEPRRHFLFAEDGITDQIVAGRRKSVYFIPIPKPKVRGKSLSLDLLVESKPEENELINKLRERVGFWRAQGYPAVTTTTKRLLTYWQRPDRSRRLFFCQLEALETIIYLTEIALSKDANQGTAFLSDLNQANASATPAEHPVLPRMACKMATGSGKTVVMAMLIVWQTLNKQAAMRGDKRFTNTFLVVSPGITIKDRLRTLYPSDPENYYCQLDLMPPSDLDALSSAKIVITNYHGFMLRDESVGAGLTKRILTGKQAVSPFLETPGQMVKRVCGALNKREIIVLNDEAHHCYHRKPDADDQKLTGDAEREAEEARVWINGLEAIDRKLGIKAVYDLSATPFFLSGSGYGEGTLFPWVVSDFALIDAIESSIVKVPRVPVEDNTDDPENPLYRNLWRVVGKQLPAGRNVAAAHLPKELQSALHHLYSHYQHTYSNYQGQIAAGFDVMPPVFIVVCSNTRISKLVFDWIAGYEKLLGEQTVIVPGNLSIFSNVEQAGQIVQWATRPNSLLIDSQRLESGEAFTEEFQQAAATEIEEFKAELRLRFPGRNTEKLTTEDLLREAMNTVGKRGKLGENIKCVVSVSMLTEGWDCRNVTHIMGIRAFGTQLLCEQVVGRGLRRMSYDAELHHITLADGSTAQFEAFPVEYAEIYGVPFEFLPMAGGGNQPKPNRATVQVFSVAERQAMRFPRVSGYRYDLPTEQLTASFKNSSQLILNTKSVPTTVESAPIIGASSIHCMEDLEARRESEVVFLLAKLVLETYFRQEPNEYAIGGKVENEVKHWLFPQLLTIARRWLNDCVIYQDNTFPQLLLLLDLAYTAAERIYQSIVSGDCQQGGAPTLRPILQPHNGIGDTNGINYLTVRETYKTSAKCPLSHVVADSGWEIKVAQALEQMPEVKAYVKNISHFDFRIPYTHEGREHGYLPDFIVRIDDGHADLLNLLIEVSGAQRDDKDAKVATVESLWVPAVNNDGRFGRWGFVEIVDPHETMKVVRGLVSDAA